MNRDRESPAETIARIRSMGFGKNDAIAVMAFAQLRSWSFQQFADMPPEQLTWESLGYE